MASMAGEDYKLQVTHEFGQQKRLHRYKAAFSGLGRGVLAAIIVLEVLRTVVGGRVMTSLTGRQDPLAEATRVWAEAIRAPAPGEQVSGKVRPNYFPTPKNKVIQKSRRLLLEVGFQLEGEGMASDKPATRRLESTSTLALQAQADLGAGKGGEAYENLSTMALSWL